jgi:NAD(P)-dependent dehydrogenase (short-subunit alcohol dehydrogenase family)
MPLRLSGKVCVITGTGGSIGRAAAVAFAREGASVIGCDLNVDASEATVAMVRGQSGMMVSLQPCQITRPADCQPRSILQCAHLAALTCCSTTPRWRTSIERRRASLSFEAVSLG